MICAACRQNFRQDEVSITCSSKTCKQTFHSACTNAELLTTDEIKQWICPDCAAKARKGGDNSHTPIRFTSDNVTLRKKQRSAFDAADAAAASGAAAGAASKVVADAAAAPKAVAAAAAAPKAVAAAAAAPKVVVAAVPKVVAVAAPKVVAAAAPKVVAAAAPKVVAAAAAAPKVVAAAGATVASSATVPKANISVTPETSPLSPEEELKSLSSEIAQLRLSASEIWDSFNLRLDIIAEKVSNYDSRIKSLEALRTENIELKATVSTLQSQLSNQAQSLLRNEVEIVGLEEISNENPCHLALTTAAKLGLTLHDTDLVYASRAGPRRKDVNDSAENNKQLQRPLVVAFIRRGTRDEFLKQAKARRNLCSKDIVGQGPDRQVYINERLTGENRRLFRSTKAFAHSHKYKHCWTRNGAIFLRKRDASQGSPAIRIWREEDLSKLSQNASTTRNITDHLDATQPPTQDLYA